MDTGKEPSVEQLKSARGHAKGRITKSVNKLNELLSANEKAEIVENGGIELNKILNEFDQAHGAYHQNLKIEVEIKESKIYCQSVHELVEEVQEKLAKYLATCQIEPPTLPQELPKIKSQDSISMVSGPSGLKSKVGSSTSSVVSAKSKAAAKKAKLLIQAKALKALQELEIEELQLKQKKATLKFQTEIAAAEAEEKIYEQEGYEYSYADESLESKALNPGPSDDKSPTFVPAHDKAKSPKPSAVVHNPNAPEWLPKQSKPQLPALSNEPFQKLMESQENQNLALQQLVQQQQQSVMALTLPQPTVPVFSGDPLHYCDFIRAFEQLIEQKTLIPSARLYYLCQFTSGECNQLVKSCLSMKEQEGYPEARRLLQERYGQAYRIAAAHVQKLIDGPSIKADDGQALQQFSIHLTSCKNTLKEIGYLNKLDNPDNLKKIINRLPYGLRLKWRDTVDRIVEDGRDVNVEDVTRFVTAKARAATHPVFGKVVNDNKVKPSFKPTPRRKADGFSSQGKEAQKLHCALCKGEHWLSRCEKFRNQSVKERQELIRTKKLCINCLSDKHFVRSCPKPSFCKVRGCTSKHSTFLHPKTSPPPPATVNPDLTKSKEEIEQPSENSSNGYVKTSCAISATVTALAIVPVKVKAHGTDEVVETYAFLDSGSNTTFCTEALLNQLHAEGKKAKLSLTTLQGENQSTNCSVVNLEVSDLDQTNAINLPVVYSRPDLPIPKEAITTQQDVDRWPHLQGIDIPSINADIGLLIGSDVPKALEPLEVRLSNSTGGPYATKTALGWVFNGPLGRAPRNAQPSSHFVKADTKLNEQFEKFCNYEFNDCQFQQKQAMSPEDRRAVEIMNDTVCLKEGHYEMALPWRQYPPTLPNNKQQAVHRLNLLKKRLRNDPKLHKNYSQFMDELFTNDHARKVTSKEVGPLGSHWYLPHHPVFNPQKPEKTRVVFDCSAVYNDTSLNQQLLQGPDLTNTLVGVLTRFREERVAFQADIKGMFLQVRVRPSDCDALRFLWWPDGDLNAEPQEYQMMVHLFGGTSSPSCANFALRKTAEDNKADFDSETVETVYKNFYIDDSLKSVDSEDKAIRLAHQLRDLLSRGGFNLTKWLSNSRKVIESLPEDCRATQVRSLDFDNLPVQRVLGVQWNFESDKFGFKITIKDRPATRRGLLSVISSVYDPLSFVAPFTLKAKFILQDLTRKKFDWDEPIPDEHLTQWQSWLADLPKLENLEISRCFKPSEFGQVVSTQLHHFSDSSQLGYGAVSYVRVEDNAGNVSCSFVMGKSRLAPIKSVTIPRLELSAAVVAARLDQICRQELTYPIDQSHFWTDSTCVLRYIKNLDKRYHTFVANRVATIHELSAPEQWSHVNTESNPADDASRGVSADSLQRWLNGPEFLLQPPQSWLQSQGSESTEIPDDDPEVKKESTVVHSTQATNCEYPLITERFTRFSNWQQLKRVITWILRYKSKLLAKIKTRKLGQESRVAVTPLNSLISVQELSDAESEIIKQVQEKHFKEEINCLRKGEQTKISKKSSHLLKLDPEIRNGLLCVGGRLQQAPVNEAARHPIILPKTDHIVDLIIRHYHELSGHSGLEHTLSLIREKFWIINPRSTVRSILNNCVSCRKRQAHAAEQKMASLPADRVTPRKPPFTFTGVDCFGPIEVKRGRTTVKRYGIIFTCLNLRAIHLEVANSLDTDSFINALRRFIARRGKPDEIRSDNGGNFVKGERELREAVDEWNQAQIHEFLLQHNTKWIFNPPAGSHHGGVWERCIRTVRKVLKAVSQMQTMSEEGLHTLMCEVEAIVNGRPITKLSDDPRDLEPLTPNHLLLLRAGSAVPPGKFNKDDSYSRCRWRQVQFLADVFWYRWIREYLPILQERQKWHKRHRNITVGDIVLVLDDKKPRNCWPLGRVQEVYTNRRDGLVRSVKVKTSTSVLMRPVDKIVLLLEPDVALAEDK